MSLQKSLEITVTMSNYNPRSSGFSATHDYLLLDSLASCPFSNLFRSDLKNLKIKTASGECEVLYLPPYATQEAAILVKIPVTEIAETTKLSLEVHDTVFSSTLNDDNVIFFDANHDTYSDYFMNYSGLSLNDDTIDGGKFLRAQFVLSPDGSSPTSLFTNIASGSSLLENRVIAGRFKRLTGNVNVSDNVIYHGNAIGSTMMQLDGELSLYSSTVKTTILNLGAGRKSYCMFDGEETIVQAISFDAYNYGSDDEGEYMQCHIHCRSGTGFSASADYIEGFLRDYETKFYDKTFHEVEIAPMYYADKNKEEMNYVDLKWLLIFPSPLFAANGIPSIEIAEAKSKTGIRLYKGQYEYPKAYRGSKLLWNADDEAMENTGLYLPEKIKDQKWVF